MYHFTYKTTYDGSEKYYVGRHSTKKIDDGYFGSGVWVNKIKDKSKLSREILSFFDTPEDLIEGERILLESNINNPNNQNYNNNPVGFASGLLNPAHTSEAAKRSKTENNWLKTPEGKKFASEHNASKLPKVKEQRREKALEQLKDGSHNFLNPENIGKKIEIARERLLSDKNPAYLEHVRKSSSERMKLLSSMGLNPGQTKKAINNRNKVIKALAAEGKLYTQSAEFKLKMQKVHGGIPKEIVTCPHCNKSGGKPAMMRYHFDKCKSLNLVKN